MVNKTWAHSPISFKNMSFSCPFLDPYLTTYHSNIGIWLRKISECKAHIPYVCYRSILDVAMQEWWWSRVSLIVICRYGCKSGCSCSSRGCEYTCRSQGRFNLSEQFNNRLVIGMIWKSVTCLHAGGDVKAMATSPRHAVLRVACQVCTNVGLVYRLMHGINTQYS